MTESDRPSQWDTISTIPAPPPDPSRRNLEQCRAQLWTERERTEAQLRARLQALDAEIAQIDRRLARGDHT